MLDHVPERILHLKLEKNETITRFLNRSIGKC